MEKERLHQKWKALDASSCERQCARCGGKLLYSWKHDAFFCPECDIWTEGACQNPGCEYCAGRPERPSQVLEEWR